MQVTAITKTGGDSKKAAKQADIDDIAYASEDDIGCDETSDNYEYSRGNTTSLDAENETIPLEEIIQKNVSKNIRDLRTFFSAGHLITEKGDQKTNIINVAEKRTYCIPDTHIEEFFIALESCRREKRIIHYAERQFTATQAKSGIMLDFDCYQKTKDIQLATNHFESLARRIGGLLGEFIDVDHYSNGADFAFKVFVIRKPEIVLVPGKAGEAHKYKDGFHLLIPEIQVTNGLKRYLIQEMTNKNILKSIFRSVNLCGDPAEALDAMSCSVPVQFVGNTRPGKPAYNLVYACEVKLLAEEDYRGVNAAMIDLSTISQYNLSYELSLYFNLKSIGGKPTWLKKREYEYNVALENKIQLLVEKTAKGILDEDDIADIENSVDLLALNNAKAAYLKKLLGILDISYATEYKKWFTVIMAIAHTSTQFKPLAVWFSHRRPEAYSVAEIDRVWNEAMAGPKHGRAPVTERSIRQWAKESAPQAFDLIDKEHYINVLAREAYSNEGRVEHAGVAKVTHSMTSYKFVVDAEQVGSKANYHWFEFVTPGQAMKQGEVYKYRRECDPDNIHLFVGEHMPKVYAQIAVGMKDRKEQAANENEAKYWAMVLKNFKTSSSKLGNDGFQKGIINQCKYRFRQRGFIDELDSYPDIMGVGNGILKLGAKPQLIRGFHEYKVSKYTETNYVPFDATNPRIQTLLSAFRDIWPEADVFDFMLFHAATGLDHKESANILTTCVGGGRNGKSFAARMIHETLGDMYCSSGKSTLLTSAFEKGGDANSAQMQQKGKNFFYIDEFEQCSVLNTTRIKSAVSPNKQSGRDLYEKQGNFINTSNLICYSNFDFIVDTTDHGTWRRIYYYRNKVKFCDNPDPENKYEKKVDHRFTDVYPHDPLYREAMLSILVHWYVRLCKEFGGDLKAVPVPTIIRETEAFRNRQDALNRFITTMIVKTTDSSEVTLTNLVEKYTSWYNVHIKKYTNKNVSPNLNTEFENSRLVNDFKNTPNNGKMLVGYRILDSASEELLPGETRLPGYNDTTDVVPLDKNKLQQECAAVIAARDAIVAPVPTDNIGEFDDAGEFANEIETLNKNAKHCIQSQDKMNLSDAARAEADAFVDCLEKEYIETDVNGTANVEFES